MVVLVIIFVGAAWYSWPIIKGQEVCYDSARQISDDVEFRTRAAGWSKRQFCDARYDNINTLKSCLARVDSLKESYIQPYFSPMQNLVFNIMRPVIKKYEEQKNAYNSDCQEFEDILIP